MRRTVACRWGSWRGKGGGGCEVWSGLGHPPNFYMQVRNIMKKKLELKGSYSFDAKGIQSCARGIQSNARVIQSCARVIQSCAMVIQPCARGIQSLGII